MGLQNKFLIDFYGKIDDSYESSFKERVDLIPNVNYQGFLNLGENEGYDKLSTYDMMLFPTYWKGEGFASVFIDSFAERYNVDNVKTKDLLKKVGLL